MRDIGAVRHVPLNQNSLHDNPRVLFWGKLQGCISAEALCFRLVNIDGAHFALEALALLALCNFVSSSRDFLR